MGAGSGRDGDPADRVAPAGGSDESQPLGVVLAGGRGERLGGAKATAELGGRPLLSYPLGALAAAGLECRVAAKPDIALPPLPEGVGLLPEPPQPRHPLCGIVAALRATAGGAAVVVPCDMPFLTPALIEMLAGAGEPLVALSNRGSLQALPGRYAATLLPELEEALAHGEALRHTVATLGARVLGEADLTRCGDPERLLFNVNDGADLRRAEELLRRPAP
jgi:molybdopterin-guanine dinucleotide biosynthesis protein A